MKFKKLLGAVCAAAVAVSAMAASAFGISEQYFFKFQDNGWENGTFDQIYGAKVTISGDFAETGVGGGIIVNSENGGWDQHEWGNADAGKEYTLNENNEIIMLRTTPLYKAEEGWAEVVIQQWWGEFEIVKVEALDKDGNVIEPAAPAPAEEEAAEDEAPAEDEAVEEVEEVAEVEEVEEVAEEIEDEPMLISEPDPEPIAETPVETAAPAAVETTAPAATGNAPVVAIAAVAAFAGAAALVSRKRK